jgi:hypothetical protein
VLVPERTSPRPDRRVQALVQVRHPGGPDNDTCREV